MDQECLFAFNHSDGNLAHLREALRLLEGIKDTRNTFRRFRMTTDAIVKHHLAIVHEAYIRCVQARCGGGVNRD